MELEHGMVSALMSWCSKMSRVRGCQLWSWLGPPNRYALDWKTLPSVKNHLVGYNLVQNCTAGKITHFIIQPGNLSRTAEGPQNPLCEALIWRLLSHRCSNHGLLFSLYTVRFSTLCSGETLLYSGTQFHQSCSHNGSFSTCQTYGVNKCHELIDFHYEEQAANISCKWSILQKNTFTLMELQWSVELPLQFVSLALMNIYTLTNDKP